MKTICVIMKIPVSKIVVHKIEMSAIVMTENRTIATGPVSM